MVRNVQLLVLLIALVGSLFVGKIFAAVAPNVSVAIVNNGTVLRPCDTVVFTYTGALPSDVSAFHLSIQSDKCYRKLGRINNASTGSFMIPRKLSSGIYRVVLQGYSLLSNVRVWAVSSNSFVVSNIRDCPCKNGGEVETASKDKIIAY